MSRWGRSVDENNDGNVGTHASKRIYLLQILLELYSVMDAVWLGHYSVEAISEIGWS